MKDWLDNLLGKVTMYRLLTLSLLVLLATSLLLGLIGYLPYSPISLLLTSLLLVGSSYGSNKLFGLIFGIRPQGESAIITGLILALILAPLSSIADVAPLILIAVVATASKYILTFRGRHIFNPAGVGALFATLSGVGYVIWWVASPALLPVTVVVSLLILYKTRHLKLGGLFLLIAVGLITIHNIMAGDSIGTAIVTVFTSWPVIYFAGVMLSEPLTLPPRRWQQLTVVSIVAILFSTSITIGSVSMTPQLALIIGNIVAFAWGTRRAVKMSFAEKLQLTPTSYEFVLKSIGPMPIHIAGQYMELTLPHEKPDSRGQRRMFTITSSPSDDDIRFGIKIPERHSSFKKTLFNLPANAYVSATKISGDFILPGDLKVPLLWIAGGIGITPFVSYVRQLIHDKQSRDITLLYSASSIQEIAYLDLLRGSGVKIIIVTPDEVQTYSDIAYIKSPYITHEIMDTSIPDIKERQVYISGPPIMVNHTKTIAKSLGARSVKTDYFTGY
ncbi:MAG: FAD-dependent oxidoreductase [Candidatus Saccharimonadales bacterium]